MPDSHYVYGQSQYSRSRFTMLLGMVNVEVVGYKERVYSPAWRRIALLMPVFAAAFWILTAEAYYFNQKYMSGISTTRRADMYLYFPDSFVNYVGNLFRKPEAIRLRERAKILAQKDGFGRTAHLQRKGEFYVSIAKAALERQDYAEFAKYIGTGASLSPANLEAQRLCADLFFAFGRPLDAYQLLEESLDFAKKDREHFRIYLYRCFMLDQDRRIIACAKKFLADPDLDPEIRGDLQIASAQAYFLRGNFPESAAVIREHKLDQTAEGYLLSCQVLWESGDRDGALEQLNAALRSYPGASRLLEMKTRWLKDMGNFAAARDSLELLRISDPGKPGPLVQSLYLMPGDAFREKRAATIEQVIREFGKQEQAMMELCRYGNDISDPALTARLVRLAGERNFTNRIRFTLMHVECLINSGRARESILLVDELYKRAEREQWTQETRIAFEALRTIAYFTDGQTEIGSINLQKLMQNRNIPPQLLISTSRKLIAAQRYDEANFVLIQTHLLNESNQAVLTQIVRLKLEHERIADDLEVYLRRLMNTRRPPKDLLETALRRLSSDRYLFSTNRTGLLKDIEALLN
jgi:hypothetical protein